MFRFINYKHTSCPIVQFTFPYCFIRLVQNWGGGGWGGVGEYVQGSFCSLLVTRIHTLGYRAVGGGGKLSMAVYLAPHLLI